MMRLKKPAYRPAQPLHNSKKKAAPLVFLSSTSLGLAPTTLKMSYETIRSIRDNHQTAMLIVEQNVDAVFSIADRVYVMALGKVVAEDIPAKLPRERLKGLFLG